MHRDLLNNLTTNFLARDLIYYKEIDSTQKEIWRRIENNKIKNGTLVVADVQTDGIGTHGRTWYNKSEGDIAFSFAVFPNISIDKINNLTKQIAEIILEVFEKLYNIELKIKSPNDIMIKDKKIGGILTQTTLKGEIIKCLVIGIGINTNKEIFEKEIENIATSIKKEFNIEINNLDVITEFCNIFEKKILERIGEIK